MKNRTRIRNMVVIIAIVIIGLIISGMLLKDNSREDVIGGADGSNRPLGNENNNQASSGEDNPTNEEDQKIVKEIESSKERGLLILVNKQNPIDENYEPTDLASIKYYAKDRTKASRYMRKEAVEHFHSLVEAAKAGGHEIVMTTAYRTYGFQKQLYNNYVATEGQEAADKFSAKPGTSEHQTGLSTDVSSPSVGYSLSYEYGETEEGKWIAENAHRFGFIIRFPKGKEDITGYNYEPWHIRYVGQAVAEEIYKKDITLEEFLEEEQ